MWLVVGGLDESVHIALDVDLWLRMAKLGTQFVTTPQMLSEALSHPAAKTTAFEELMRLDCAIVVIKHGGGDVVRGGLEAMVNQLGWYRRNYEGIVNNPVLKLLRPLLKRFEGPGGHLIDAGPPWTKAP